MADPKDEVSTIKVNWHFLTFLGVALSMGISFGIVVDQWNHILIEHAQFFRNFQQVEHRMTILERKNGIDSSLYPKLEEEIR